MSLKSTEQEQSYLNALGYSTTKTISTINRKLIKKLVVENIPVEAVKKACSNKNYGGLKSNNVKENFINKLIKAYNEKYNKELIEDVEIIPDEEVKFIDSNEHISKPKPNLKRIETINVNNNLSKMSRGVTFNKRKGLPLESINDLYALKTRNNGVKKYNEAFLAKAKPILNTTYDYSAKYEHPDYAAAYANKIGGKVFRGDINDDKVDDIVITDKSGRIKYFNGHTIKPSTRGKDLDYYDSDVYKNAPFQYKTKNGRVINDLLGQHSRSEFNKTMTPQTKKAANETLRKAGFATYQVKEKTLNKILKDSAAELYKNVIETIVARHKNVNKTKLKQQLPMARFEQLIVNAILLKMYKADFTKSKSYLDQLVANLKKAWDKDKNSKQSVVEHANSAIDVLSNPNVLEELAGHLYNITLKDSKHGEIYEAIIKLIGEGVKISKELKDYYETEVESIERARKDGVNAYRKQYYEDHPDKKPKSKKATKGSKKATKEPGKLQPLPPELMPPVRKPKKQQVISDDSTEDYVLDG